MSIFRSLETKTDDQPNTRQIELININQTRTKKADENFWRRSSQLLKTICKITNLAIESLNKKRLTELYFFFFPLYFFIFYSFRIKKRPCTPSGIDGCRSKNRV